LFSTKAREILFAVINHFWKISFVSDMRGHVHVYQQQVGRYLYSKRHKVVLSSMFLKMVDFLLRSVKFFGGQAVIAFLLHYHFLLRI